MRTSCGVKSIPALSASHARRAGGHETDSRGPRERPALPCSGAARREKPANGRRSVSPRRGTKRARTSAPVITRVAMPWPIRSPRRYVALISWSASRSVRLPRGELRGPMRRAFVTSRATPNHEEVEKLESMSTRVGHPLLVAPTAAASRCDAVELSVPAALRPAVVQDLEASSNALDACDSTTSVKPPAAPGRLENPNDLLFRIRRLLPSVNRSSR